MSVHKTNKEIFRQVDLRKSKGIFDRYAMEHELRQASDKLIEQTTEIERLRETLRALEFTCGGDDGGLYCPLCWETREDGHEPGCAVAAALNPSGPPAAS